jgi:hypothetical protein
MAMHHALVGLMCDSGPWRHPNGDAASIIDIEFNRDGTGKVGVHIRLLSRNLCQIQAYIHESS